MVCVVDSTQELIAYIIYMLTNQNLKKVFHFCLTAANFRCCVNKTNNKFFYIIVIELLRSIYKPIILSLKLC